MRTPARRYRHEVPDAPADERSADEPDDDSGSDADEASTVEREPTRVPLPLIGVIAGLMVGAGIVAVLAITGFFRSEASSPKAEDDARHGVGSAVATRPRTRSKVSTAAR